MPYVRCPHCGLRSYSAARFSSRDVCPGCHEMYVLAPQALRDAEEAEPVTAGRFGEESDDTG
jgi:hypothetical protein